MARTALDIIQQDALILNCLRDEQVQNNADLRREELSSGPIVRSRWNMLVVRNHGLGEQIAQQLDEFPDR